MGGVLRSAVRNGTQLRRSSSSRRERTSFWTSTFRARDRSKRKFRAQLPYFVLPPSFAELERRLRCRSAGVGRSRSGGVWKSRKAKSGFIVTTTTSSSTTFSKIPSVSSNPSCAAAHAVPRASAKSHRGDHRFLRRFSLIQIPDNIDSKYRFVILSALARPTDPGRQPAASERAPSQSDADRSERDPARTRQVPHSRTRPKQPAEGRSS